MWISPLAYGGPSCRRKNLGAPCRAAELAVQIHLLPASDRLRLSRLQVGLHREGRARQVTCVLPLGHGSLSIVIMALWPCRASNSHAGVRETVLDNGLKVLVQEVHTAPLASVWCWYQVGSKDEGPGLTGVSHWVEHMNFKGTRNIPRDQVKGIIEQFGGTWNGYTWIDQTTYLETATTRRARSHAVHRGRAHERVPLRARRTASRSAPSSSRS